MCKMKMSVVRAIIVHILFNIADNFYTVYQNIFICDQMTKYKTRNKQSRKQKKFSLGKVLID